MYDGYQPYLDAFWELDTDRDFAAGNAPIPHRSIAAWSERSSHSPDEAADFLYFIRVMDRAFRSPDAEVNEAEPLTVDSFAAMFGSQAEE